MYTGVCGEVLLSRILLLRGRGGEGIGGVRGRMESALFNAHNVTHLIAFCSLVDFYRQIPSTPTQAFILT